MPFGLVLFPLGEPAIQIMATLQHVCKASYTRLNTRDKNRSVNIYPYVTWTDTPERPHILITTHHNTKIHSSRVAALIYVCNTFSFLRFSLACFLLIFLRVRCMTILLSSPASSHQQLWKIVLTWYWGLFWGVPKISGTSKYGGTPNNHIFVLVPIKTSYNFMKQESETNTVPYEYHGCEEFW